MLLAHESSVITPILQTVVVIVVAWTAYSGSNAMSRGSVVPAVPRYGRDQGQERASLRTIGDRIAIALFGSIVVGCTSVPGIRKVVLPEKSITHTAPYVGPSIVLCVVSYAGPGR